MILFLKLLVNADRVRQYADKLKHITVEKMGSDNFTHRDIMAFGGPDWLIVVYIKRLLGHFLNFLFFFYDKIPPVKKARKGTKKHQKVLKSTKRH